VVELTSMSSKLLKDCLTAEQTFHLKNQPCQVLDDTAVSDMQDVPGPMDATNGLTKIEHDVDSRHQRSYRAAQRIEHQYEQFRSRHTMRYL